MSLEQRLVAAFQAVGADIKQLQAQAAPSVFFRTEAITATVSGQTSFTVPGGYTPGAIFVSLNGAALAPADFAATNGTTVVLASGTGIVAGSVLLVYVLSAFQVADALPLGGTAADSSKLGGQPPEFYLGGGSWGSITGTLANQTDLQTALNSKANSADVNFAIIYPNGGAAESPSLASVSTRYAVANPYPGHEVVCKVQFQRSGVWGDVDAATIDGSGSGAAGAKAFQLGDEIIIQTARYLLRDSSNNDRFVHHPFTGVNSDVTSAPFRVKVWKLKGAIA
jgi:hypothetical protein